MMRTIKPLHRPARGQRGVVLYVAIIVLVAMTLAGLAMMRQMGVGTSIAGNVAFKENATSAADSGTEAGRAWLAAHQAILDNDHFGSGYHSAWSASVDPTTFNWDTESQQLPVDVGNVAWIYIERLCATPNLSAIAATQVCSDKPVGSSTTRGGASYPTGLSGPPPQPYFRVTTRVDGPRNTRSYTQVLMQ